MALQDNVRVAALVLAGELGALGSDEITPEASAALGYPAADPERSPGDRARAPSPTSRGGARGGCAGSRPGRRPRSWSRNRPGSRCARPRATDSLLVFAESDPATGCRRCLDPPRHRVGRGGELPRRRSGHRRSGRCSGAARSGGAGPGHAGIAGPARRGDADAVLPVGRQVVVRHALGQHRRGHHAGRRAARRQHRRACAASRWSIATPPTPRPRIPTAVRAVEIALVGVTDQPIHGRDLRRPLVDSFALTTRVALRNALRP